MRSGVRGRAAPPHATVAVRRRYEAREQYFPVEPLLDEEPPASQANHVTRLSCRIGGPQGQLRDERSGVLVKIVEELHQERALDPERRDEVVQSADIKHRSAPSL